MSNNLNLDQLTTGQASKEATINNATGQLDAALTESLDLDFTSADITISATNYERHLRFNYTNTVSHHALTLLAQKKLSILANDSGHSATAILGTTTLSIANGEHVVVYTDGTANGLIQLGSSSGGTLASDTDVNLTSPANGDVLTYDSGTSKWINSPPSGGGGGGSGGAGFPMLFDLSMGVPSLASMTQVNISGNHSVSENPGVALTIHDTGAGGATVVACGLAKAAPATPYIVGAYCIPTIPFKDNLAMMWGWLDSGGSKIDAAHTPSQVSAGPQSIGWAHWSNPTTFGSSGSGDCLLGAANAPGIWLTVANDGTSIILGYSNDGVNIVPIRTVALGSAYTDNNSYYFGLLPDNNASPNKPASVTILAIDEHFGSRVAGTGPGSGPGSPNDQTGTTYTFVAGDASVSMVRGNNASAQTYTIPTNASVPFPIGTTIIVSQKGAGQITFVGAGGVTTHSQGGLLAISGQYGQVALTKTATDEWYLTGALA